jgi:hypothetical protein
MKNITAVTAADDVTSYDRVIKSKRSSIKKVLVEEKYRVTSALNNYADAIVDGTAQPLGFTGNCKKFHYSLYDSTSLVITQIKSKLRSKYNGHNCPYCQIDCVSHIDHFLPRSKFPELSVSLQNLLMSCDTCNSVFKKEIWGNKTHQMIMHPMLNEILNNVYLIADVNYGHRSFQVDFRIQTGLALSPLLERHFSTMDLNDRYRARITSIEVPKLSKLLAEEPTTPAKTHRLNRFVKDAMTTYEPNSIEHAFYSSVLPIVPAIARGGL